MTIKTPATFTPPPNAGEGQGGGKPLYRKWERSITNDGQGEVNFADAICKLNDPNSGEAINVNATVSGAAPIPNFRATTALGRKVHFEMNLDTGLDTTNSVNCVFDGSLLAESRNASGTSANGAVSADLGKSSLSLQVNADAPNSDFIISESKNYIKMPATGITFLEIQGVFEHNTVTDNPTAFYIGTVVSGATLQASWNIDPLDSSGQSGIDLDFKKVQTAVCVFSGKNKGDVKVGFLVDDTLYFANQFQVNNTETNTRTLNLPFRDTIGTLFGNVVVREVGLFNESEGVSFFSVMDATPIQTLPVQQYLNNAVCYTVGADEVEKKIPFVAGNKANLVTVTAADTPLFSIQCAPTFNGAINRTVYNIDSLSVAASSQNENFGCYISVLYNATLDSSNFIALPNNPESALLYNLDATTATGGVEIFATELMANEKSTFSMADIFKNYRKEFSRNEISGVNVPAQVLNQTLTVVASPMQGVISTTSLDVSANIFGGEVG